MNAAKNKVASLLAHAGIAINGGDPWDMQINDDRVFRRILAKGSIGIGESYMDGWWDVPRLDQFFTKALSARVPERLKFNLPTLWLVLKSSILNMQTKNRASKVVKEHYDLGNDLYMSFLDPYNQYTCGYFKETDGLNTAQEHKLDLICRKLELKSTDKVLICGMLEHVGYRNYRTIMNKVHEVLSDTGLFLLHTIGTSVSDKSTDPWFGKYIFPNSMTPSVPQISKAAEDLFVIEDWHNFGIYYVKTLLAWYDNFKTNWDKIKSNYSDRLFRMWEYYLLSSVGFFESRTGQLWQVVFSKNGVPGGYVSIR